MGNGPKFKCKNSKMVENIGENLCDFWSKKDFLDMTPKALSTKEQT